MTEAEIAANIVSSLFILCMAFFALWRVAEGDRRYWKSQADRYQQMWDRATWNPDDKQEPPR